LKVTLRVQSAPAATLVPHVFVCVKSAASTPVTVMLVTFSVPVPVLVRVTVCGALVVATNCSANVKLVGDSVTTGALSAGLGPADCARPDAPMDTSASVVNAIVVRNIWPAVA
jgi:hypothetical protein